MKDFATDPRRIWNGRLIHFRQRLAERVSPDLDAGNLWRHIINLMSRPAGPDGDMRFCGRTRSGCRVWLIVWQGHRVFAVYDHDMGCPVTVLPSDGHCYINGRRVDLGRIA